jgi:hypothetical protein
MAIDESGKWWIGSEATDIERYLREYTQAEAAYAIDYYLPVVCPCGNNLFNLQRASDIVRRECVVCGDHHFICREPEDWEEAVDDRGAESISCVECNCQDANVGIGFACYAGDVDGVKWFYVGVRCASCGVLGCFGDGKVGWGPAADVYRKA